MICCTVRWLLIKFKVSANIHLCDKMYPVPCCPQQQQKTNLGIIIQGYTVKEQAVESWVSTDRPTSPLIHINIFTSAEINPLNHPSQKGLEGDAMARKKTQPNKNRRDDAVHGLTWPYHHVWNTTDFPFSQSKDLM